MTAERKTTTRRPKGEGSIYKRPDGRWEAQISLGRGPNGKRIRRKVTGRTKTEVSQTLALLRRQAAEGQDLSARSPTVEQLAQDWLAKTTNGLAPATRGALSSIVEQHVVPGIGHHRVDKLRVEHIEQWLAAEASKGLSKASLVKYRQVLRQILTWAVRRRLITWNPAKVVEIPPTTRTSTEKRALDAKQAELLLEVLADDRLGPYFTTMLLLGVRPGELDGLPWSAVDLDDGTVTIGQALKRDNAGRPVDLGPTKTRSTRVLALPTPLIAALRHQRAQQAADRLAAGPLYGTDPRWQGLVFLNEIGGPLDPSNCRRALASACRRAGLPELTPYELRHTAASLLVEAGLRPYEVADQLGHADLRMLERHYRHKLAPVISAGAAYMEKLAAGVAPAGR